MRTQTVNSVLGVGFGLALLAAVIYFNAHDLRQVGAALDRAPLGLAISVAVHVPQIVLTAAAWRMLLPRPRPRLARMTLLRWIRESLNALVPAGAILGQAVAARWLIRSGVAADLASATATVDMTVEGATQALFTLTGVLLLLATQADLHLARAALVGVCVAAAAAIAMVVVQRKIPVRLLERMVPRVLGSWLALRSGWLAEFQRSVWHLHTQRTALLRAACCHSAAWALGSVEIAGVARLFGFSLSLTDGLIVESLTQALRSAAFMVPGALGVQEGAIIAACGLVGVPADVALMIALLRRAREVLIGVPGLLVWRARRRPARSGAVSADATPAHLRAPP